MLQSKLYPDRNNSKVDASVAAIPQGFRASNSYRFVMFFGSKQWLERKAGDTNVWPEI
jgi:hypothetical protein